MIGCESFQGATRRDGEDGCDSFQGATCGDGEESCNSFQGVRYGNREDSESVGLLLLTSFDMEEANK